METSNAQICPVCTLYLREGITLQAHLDTHPKDQVIGALLKLSNTSIAPVSQQSPVSSGPSTAPVQTVQANTQSSFISAPFATPQSQMTTAVTYQQFMTSNGSTLMPQIIQVPAVVNQNNNIPVIANQQMNLIPNQTVNYSQTMYNPLYNPYIPQPYPFCQSVYSSLPVSSVSSPSNSNIQTSTQVSSETTVQEINSHEEQTFTQTNAIAKSTSTNVELGKTSSRRITKKSIVRRTGICKRRRILPKYCEPSTSFSVIKSTVRSSLLDSGKGPVMLKSSVIRTYKPKKRKPPTTSDAADVKTNILLPPLTLIPGETGSGSVTSSEPPAPPPLAKVPPYILPASFIKSEDVTDCARPHSTPAIIISSIPGGDGRGSQQDTTKGSSVIVDTAAVTEMQTSQMSDERSDERCVDDDDSGDKGPIGTEEEPAEPVRDPLSMEVDIDRDGCLAEEDTASVEQMEETTRRDEECDMEYERDTDEVDNRRDGSLEGKETVFHMIEIVESKINISETSLHMDEEEKDEGGDGVGDDADGFDQQDNAEEYVQESTDSSYTDTVQSRSGEGKNWPSADEVRDRDPKVTEGGHDPAASEKAPHLPVLQPVTYTDLQPAKSSSGVIHDLGLNLNSFMEVDGIKIFFNNGGAGVPFIQQGHGGKEFAGKAGDGHAVNNQQAIVDSVIQLVSATSGPTTDGKAGFPFGDAYGATSSTVGESQLDLSDLSPLALNIQTDETMPARGELSEQESLGAENSTWNLFHGENAADRKILEEWRNSELPEVVSIVAGKKTAKKFKCSVCSEVFSCPKERRVHKNTAHLNVGDKGETTTGTKKAKTYLCNFCGESFTSLRDRKLHVLQNHFREPKRRKVDGLVKEESTTDGGAIGVTGTGEDRINGQLIKDESELQQQQQQQQGDDDEDDVDGVKTETSLPGVGPDGAVGPDANRVKYCSKCTMPFVGVKKLREHLRIVHGEIRYKCETCSQTFDEETDYNEHLLVHPLVCDKCGKTFHKKPNLNLHMKRHLEVKPYECSLCPKSFITRQKLEEHMNGHSGKKPLKCPNCDKTFSRHSNLIQHRNMHHSNVKKKVKDFVCRCGEVFHSLRKLEWHKETHEAKPKPCPFCSQKFVHTAGLTRHIRRAHLPDYLPGDNREFDNVQCPVCEKVYLRSSLMVHMRVHNGEKPFGCKICNKKFSTKWNLELHNWTHQSRSNMPFKCNVCKSAFFREPDFVAHVNSHRNYKPFTCNVCGQKFIRKYSCLRHQEEHKKAKQYICGVSGCAKSFHRGYYLRDHMKVHTGARPHTCHICGKASSTKSNHNKHMRIHDTREPVNTEN